MSFFLILLLSIFPDNSRFGVFNSRIGGENSRFGRQQKFARNGLIWLTIFATKAWFQGKVSEFSRFIGKSREFWEPASKHDIARIGRGYS